MLSALGVVAEFNPFHNGHRRFLKLARRRSGADVTVIVMSGNWVQRGQPALVDKWARTRMALANGADLVVELPAPFAVQPANEFADQAIKLIRLLRCRWLAFGCEHANWNFDRLARIKLPRDHRFFRCFRYPYSRLSRDFFYRYTGVRLDQPNDILGVNYARAKLRQRVKIRLLPVQRLISHTGRGSHVSRITNSTLIRQQLLKTTSVATVKNWLPPNCLQDLRPPWSSWVKLWPELRCQLVETALPDLSKIYQMREGLEYRLQRVAVQANDFRQFLDRVKTKRYTYSRLRRLCFYTLIQLRKRDWQRIRSHTPLRILGFNQRGRQYLHQIKKRLRIPLITVASQGALKRMHWNVKAGWLIEMMTGRSEDFYRHPVIR